MRAGLSELTTFIAIAEVKSFREAARRIGVSPSALSHTMRGLEARLNMRLFNRTTRSVALTKAGEQLLRRIKPAIADLDNAMEEAASAMNRPSGSIRITCAETGALPIVRHVLPGFLASYPDIHVEFVVDTRLADIVADGFDAGIRIFDDVPRDMVAIRFSPDWRLAVVASPAYLDAHGIPQAPKDLLAHRCIRSRFASGTLYRWEFQKDGESYELDVDGPMTLGNPNLMVEAALQGIGLAWVPLPIVADYLASGRLVEVLTGWNPTLAGACLYYPANRHPPTALRLFTQALRDWANSHNTGL